MGRCKATQGDSLVRPARESDAESIARVHIESTREAYAPLAKVWPEPDWDGKKKFWEGRLAPCPTDPRRVDLVAEAQGRVVGFISGGEARQAGIGVEVEIYVIHVLPEHRGTGIGARLWSEACRRIRGESLCAMYVATLAELRCGSFYEHRGGVSARRSARMFHGAPATDVIYIWGKGCSHEAMPSDVRPH
jgi:ribosomal protein S18 acetylase RimI-like enzyme